MRLFDVAPPAPILAVEVFGTVWPYLGLALGGAILASLTLRRRPDGSPSRLRDPAWLIALFLPVYMFHQFEEHGIDLFGRHFQFIHELCAVFHAEVRRGCPADEAFITAVNPGAVWLAGLIAFVLRTKRPIVGAYTWGIVIANIPAHVGAAIVHGEYNAGLATAVFLFIPAAAFAMRGFLDAGVIDRKRLVAAVATGAVVHAVLIGSLVARQAGWLDEALLVLVNLANGLVPYAMARLLGPLNRDAPVTP